MVRIGVITAPRGTSYLRSTIDSMRAQDALARGATLGVFSDSVEPPPVRADYFAVRTQAELDELRSGPYIGVDNLARALRWASGASVAVAGEDDYFFARGWLSRGVALLEAVEHAGVVRPVICLSHCWEEVSIPFVDTGLRVEGDALWGLHAETLPMGWAPAIMRSDTAVAIADALQARYRRIEQDWALLQICRDEGVATQLFVDPCLGMHVGLTSLYNPNRAAHDAYTHRFRPF